MAGGGFGFDLQQAARDYGVNPYAQGPTPNQQIYRPQNEQAYSPGSFNAMAMQMANNYQQPGGMQGGMQGGYGGGGRVNTPWTGYKGGMQFDQQGMPAQGMPQQSPFGGGNPFERGSQGMGGGGRMGWSGPESVRYGLR